MNDHFRIEPKKKAKQLCLNFRTFYQFFSHFPFGKYATIYTLVLLFETLLRSAWDRYFIGAFFSPSFSAIAFMSLLLWCGWENENIHLMRLLAVYFIKFVNDVFSIVILPVLNIWKQFFFAFFSAQLHFIVRKNKERRERERKKTFQSVDNYTAFTWEHQLWRRKKWTFFSLFIQISIGLKCSIWNFDTNEPNDTHSIEIHFD